MTTETPPDVPIDETTAWRLLAPWDANPGNARLERHAVYRFQARWVTEWRRGRVLLAGLEDDDLEDRLDRIQLERLTPTTVADHYALREQVDRAREAGWSMVDQELEQGVRSASVPIRDATGAVVAAMNVSVHASRMTMQALRREVVPKLLRTAEAIENDLRAAAPAGSANTA